MSPGHRGRGCVVVDTHPDRIAEDRHRSSGKYLNRLAPHAKPLRSPARPYHREFAVILVYQQHDGAVSNLQSNGQTNYALSRDNPKNLTNLDHCRSRRKRLFRETKAR